MNFNQAVELRRSYYGISNEQIVSDDRIQDIIEHAVVHTPTAFNSQSGRVILLLDKQHDRLWNIVMDAMKKKLSEDRLGDTEKKINSFKAGYGTVLYFEDDDIVRILQKKFPTYAHNFSNWAEQANGILQYIIWVTLELEGFGVSLQHYNELIEDTVKDVWNVPDNWRLVAQMPFGKPIQEPGEIEYAPVDERVKVYK